MIGKDLIDIRDGDGKYYMRERIEIIKTKGKGWQDYKFLDPLTKKIEPKSMYIEKFDDLIVGCGIYKPD
ncbi:Methyl-accepting chemotaxis protein 4 [compost metagenome]